MMSGLFGNNNINNNSGLNQSSPFSNNFNNQQNIGLFGNNNNNNNQGSVLFGFNNNQQNQNNNTTNQSNLFMNGNNNQGNMFLNNNNNNNNQNQNINYNTINNNNKIKEIQSSIFFTTISPAIALSQSNKLRNIELKHFPEEYQNTVMILKDNLKEQESTITELKRYSKRINELLEEDNKYKKNIKKSNRAIEQKLNIIENIINKLKENNDFIFETYQDEEKILESMEQDKEKIDIPSKFLVEFSRNLLKKTELFKQKFDNVFTLIKVASTQYNNHYIFDSDIMISTLGEYIKIVKSLLESKARQQKLVNEMLQALFKLFSDLGENIEIHYNDIMKYGFEQN